MTINEKLRQNYPELSASQLEIIGCTRGPLLVVAGPGSGKTLVLVMRALNILLQNLAKPEEMLICTFTEKAAFELRDRILEAARKLEYPGDLSGLRLGTIHSICNEFLRRYRHHTPLGNNYEVLDDLTQLMFIFENFKSIMGPEIEEKYLGRWTTRWTAIEGARKYFNKIAEELIDPRELIEATDPFLQAIGSAYQIYESTLYEKNRIDFAHQEKLFYHMLQDPLVGEAITNEIKYVMVDEYQDTNY
ncbi:UvrD-helicase domain-containing protein, partial [Candidatus Bathyarchaeota archaeon]|nr:UvrD-helicase domain-containing protein [Candidatus Bathyarchaeota archaeon]